MVPNWYPRPCTVVITDVPSFLRRQWTYWQTTSTGHCFLRSCWNGRGGKTPAHRAAHQRPISAETLRRRMAIGAERSRRLVALVRSETQVNQAADDLDGETEGCIAQAA